MKSASHPFPEVSSPFISLAARCASAYTCILTLELHTTDERMRAGGPKSNLRHFPSNIQANGTERHCFAPQDLPQYMYATDITPRQHRLHQQQRQAASANRTAAPITCDWVRSIILHHSHHRHIRPPSAGSQCCPHKRHHDVFGGASSGAHSVYISSVMRGNRRRHGHGRPL